MSAAECEFCPAPAAEFDDHEHAAPMCFSCACSRCEDCSEAALYDEIETGLRPCR